MWNRILPSVYVLLFFAWPLQAAEYKDYDAAMRAGGISLREKQVAASQEPFEAAVKLATTDKDRLKAYQALLGAYRLLPDADKMLEAQEFILRNAETTAARSLASRDVASFLHQRGKTDWAIERYEARVQKDPNDPAAVGILARVYALKPDQAQKEAIYEQKAKELNLVLAAKVAERFEKAAADSMKLAAWNWKEAATAWLEANDKVKAVAAANKAIATGPEQRTPILAYYWHVGLGDVFAKTGDTKRGIEQYEAAIASAPAAAFRQPAELKLATLKAAKP
ncbi:hypothetical protein ETAA8_09770 [Anatilimnocola aggregata]|uniref:Tetratricopeptide repeat protein n=1 Tax=Anatilimnocola aggregata TaxID=2528021 RepID=A0A517Y6Q7_9BACT|nr:hypothetical protein [Anatilimnocola aggregata]QDU25905.1 hypothetical protein ETAA8_09770 [Anatilimnocola aggregata]